IVILSEINDYDDIEKVAQKILGLFQTPINIKNYEHEISTSIGISVYPDIGEDMDVLLRSADIALYRAKDRGRDRYQFFDEDMKQDLHKKLSLEKDLRSAIRLQQLKLLYQPYIDLKTNKVVGAEALIRWDHPTLGLLSPNEFISLAEETGLIITIGNWVIKKACKQIRAWKKLGNPLSVSINLSAKQLAGNNLVNSIRESLDTYNVEPKYLELEITESIAMQNKEQTSSKLKELVDMGMSITMDDFGTGYSSLSYLKGFHVQKIKIDQSFVKDVNRDPQDAAIVRTIISMGHTLGLKVCAEGIETTKQKNFLTAVNCDAGQGFLVCKPVEAEKLWVWNQNRNLVLNTQS
ncbi:MAG: bifunctional diguanylate cyclase/phosphodiesterase, partial [Candidatus Doudnabacteria bacterium]|nr:bifunctional diguanylate cyclase/phosphodiesterase [Candidatus Doudnabacteria bacterium]